MAKSRRPKADQLDDLDDGFHIVHVDGRIMRIVSPTISTLQNFDKQLPDWLESLVSGNEGK